VLALWLDDSREVIPQEAHLLDGKVVVDPSNPIGFDRNGQIFKTVPDDQSPVQPSYGTTPVPHNRVCAPHGSTVSRVRWSPPADGSR
jgi:hypothetical protein